MMMHMTFYFGYENVDVLFSGITINTKAEMIWACLILFIISMLYEGLKVLRQSLLRHSLTRDVTKYSPPSVYSSNAADNIITTRTLKLRKMTSLPHVIQTFLHALQISVSYALMLIFMTYNGYLAISIIIGSSCGYFLFGWKQSVVVDSNEHCH